MVAPKTPSFALDEAPVGDRIDCDGWLNETEEEFAAMSRPATVESKRELVEVVVQMHLAHRAVMGPKQPAFEQRHHAAAAGRRRSLDPVLVPVTYHIARNQVVRGSRVSWKIVPAVTVQQVLGLGSYQTAWAWVHKLRRAMVRPDRDRLSGEVEVDETLVGGRGGNRGRGAGKKALIVVAAEVVGHGIGRIRMRRISDGSAATLQAFIDDAIEPGSDVHTDGWDGYEQVKHRYHHRVSYLRGHHELASQLLPRSAAILAASASSSYPGTVGRQIRRASASAPDRRGRPHPSQTARRTPRVSADNPRPRRETLYIGVT